MQVGYSEQHFCQLYAQYIHAARCCNSGGNVGEKRYVTFKKKLADKIAYACSEECAYHLNRSSAKKEGKCTARKSGCKPEIPALIVACH